MNFRHRHLIHALNSGIWHMRAESVQGYMPKVISFLTEQNPQSFYDEDSNSEAKKARKTEQISRFVASYSLEAKPYIESWYYDYPPFLVGNVLVIPIMEAIDQEDYCGIAGTNTIRGWYEMAKNDEAVVGVVELVNSGGGSVFGTSELAIYKEDYPKPIVTYTTGLCCSAAYYIASSSKYIVASSKSVIVGSIGVMTTFVNFTNYYKKMGIDVKELYSSTSSLKNDAHRQAQKGNFKAYTDGILFDLDKNFMEFVSKHRADLTQRVLDGADMIAEQGMQEGLIDEIGSMDVAIQKVQDLAIVNTNNKMATEKKKMILTSNAILLGMAGALVKAGASNLEVKDVEETTAETTEEKPENQQQNTTVQTEQKTETVDFAALISQAVTAAVKPFEAKLTALEGKLNQRVQATKPTLEDNQQDVS